MTDATLYNLIRRIQGGTTTTCDQCGKSYVGRNDTPLFMGLRDTGIGEDMVQGFCSWECAASWFAARAGVNPTPIERSTNAHAAMPEKHTMLREPAKRSPAEIVDRFFTGHAADVMATFPDSCIDLVVTSPPYWTAVEYDQGENPWRSYEDYLADLQSVWNQCDRVLRPNGKLCINAPILPIPKKLIQQHTRHLKNIASDIEHRILQQTKLERFDFFVWQKQTSKMMFGSYPYPGNIFANNTIEFINVYVKPGKPPKFDAEVKNASQITWTEHQDLSQQISFMYPEDVKREGDHPAPFPQKLPGRLIRLYSYRAADDFPGEIVLDPFVGTGTTCAIAKSMGRRYVGIDINPAYVKIAQERVRDALGFEPLLLVGRPKYPGKEELKKLAAAEARTKGKAAEAKHKRKTYGRKVAIKKDEQLKLV
jgi:DNA modification methylase